MVGDTDRSDRGDSAPGDMAREGLGAGLRSYLLGFGLAATLTAASFWASQTHLVYAPAVPVAIAVLAIAQMGIHLVFFLHITTARDNTNNVLALAFGVLIVFLIVFGSIWIMTHLAHGLSPTMSRMDDSRSAFVAELPQDRVPARPRQAVHVVCLWRGERNGRAFVQVRRTKDRVPLVSGGHE